MHVMIHIQELMLPFWDSLVHHGPWLHMPWKERLTRTARKLRQVEVMELLTTSEQHTKQGCDELKWTV